MSLRSTFGAVGSRRGGCFQQGGVQTAQTPPGRRAAEPNARQAAKAARPALRDSSVGRTTFAPVEALVKEGSSTTDAAFRAVAKT